MKIDKNIHNIKTNLLEVSKDYVVNQQLFLLLLLLFSLEMLYMI